MAYREAFAEIFRTDLAQDARVEEKRMFGGLCFMLDGHMLCGVHKDDVMFRVGKERTAAALALDGVFEMDLSGRKMGGLVKADAAVMNDDARRAHLLALARENVASLPPR